ncbi:MAG: TIR domain-containing protein, partial [Burkholderiaceae bacterium]
MSGIFISYRRDDSAGYAGRLYDRLVGHFGPERVFMDVEGISPGLDFVEAIEQAVGSCQVLIVVIGDEWTTIADAAGRRRLDDPHDFIRLETGTALRRKIRVVPVLVGGAVMPHVDELPDDIKTLTRRQAVEINHKQWDASTGELIRALEGILAQGEAPAVASPAVALPTARAPSNLVSDPLAIQQTAHNTATRDGTAPARRWLAGAGALVLLAAFGWWVSRPQHEPGTASRDAATQSPSAGTVNPAPGAVPGAPQVIDRGPVVALAPQPPATASQQPPSEPAAANPARAEPATPAALLASSASTPEPSRAAVATPAPSPGTAPSDARRSTPTPSIRSFTAKAAGSQVRLCYRVSDATRVELAPQPGGLAKTDQDCVTVVMDAPTIFTLTARNGSESTSKRIAVQAPVASAPTPQAPPTPAQSATAPATSPAIANSGKPVVGERWSYRSSGKWRTSAQRRIEFVVRSVAGTVVTDALSVLEPETAGAVELRRSRGDRPDFVAWSTIGPEFSPYFGAFVDLLQQSAMSGLATPDLDPQWSGWYSEATVLGRESVQVPAGRFDAIKVEVWSTRKQTGGFSQARVEP